MVNNHGAGADEFWSCCADGYFFSGFFDGEENMVEAGRLVFVDDFCVCQSSATAGAVIVNAVFLVDEAFFPEVNKCRLG